MTQRCGGGRDAARRLSDWTGEHTDPKDRNMTQTAAQPVSISARKPQADADAVLDQMFAYFTRDEMPNAIETRRAA